MIRHIGRHTHTVIGIQWGCSRRTDPVRRLACPNGLAKNQQSCKARRARAAGTSQGVRQSRMIKNHLQTAA